MLGRLIHKILVAANDIELIYEEELGDVIDDDPYRRAKDSGINILRHMEFYCGHVSDEDKLISGLFVNQDPNAFEFDIFVDQAFRGLGLASKLVDIAIDLAEFSDSKFNVHVVNPQMLKILKGKGFEIVEDNSHGGETDVIMTRDDS